MTNPLPDTREYNGNVYRKGTIGYAMVGRKITDEHDEHCSCLDCNPPDEPPACVVENCGYGATHGRYCKAHDALARL